MTKNKYHSIQRRTTFKKHSKNYKRVYHPFLPVAAIIGLAGLAIIDQMFIGITIAAIFVLGILAI